MTRKFDLFKMIPNAKPVDPVLMKNFCDQMREQVIPEIVASIRRREKAAAEIRSKNIPLY